MNDKQKAFADIYLSNGCNGTQAYLQAYPTVKKEDTARVNASKLLTNANIQEYIKAEQEKTSQKLEITRESVLEDLKRIQATTESTNPNASLKSLEMMCKLLGLYEPIKQDVTSNGNQIGGEFKITIIKPNEE